MDTRQKSLEALKKSMRRRVLLRALKKDLKALREKAQKKSGKS